MGHGHLPNSRPFLPLERFMGTICRSAEGFADGEQDPYRVKILNRSGSAAAYSTITAGQRP
jgi:hypothetical protein